MTIIMAVKVTEWFGTDNALQTLLWVAYAFIIAATGIVGAFASGYVVRGVCLIFWRDLSRAAILRIRLVSGAASGILAYLLISPGMLGIGTGPGPGGVPSTGPSLAEKRDEAAIPEPAKPEPPPAIGPAASPKAEPSPTLRVLLLGENTTPSWQPKNRYFAFAEEANPQALDMEAILERVEARKREGNIQKVELVYTPMSTSLQNLEVQRLRRAIEQTGLRFDPPDPEQPRFPQPP